MNTFWSIIGMMVLAVIILIGYIIFGPIIKVYILKRKLKKQGPSKAREYAKKNLKNIKEIANNPTTLLAQNLLKILEL